MIIDSRNEFSDAQAVTTQATNNSTNQIDLGTGDTDIGHGEPVYLVVTCDETATSGGAATVTIQLASDASASIATNGTQTIHWASKAFALADLTAGKVLAQVVLPDGAAAKYERYLGVQYVVGTAALTAGKFSAFLTTDSRSIRTLPDAVN